MFENMHRETDFVKKTRSLERKLKGKKDLKQNCCKCCTYCCWLKPCNLVKEDVQIMSDYFNVTPNELFKKYLVVDTAGVEYGLFTLTPIRIEWEKYAGYFLPSDATYDINTPCIFLDEKEKKCKLHGVAKPQGGTDVECWVKNKEYEDNNYGFTKAELKDLVGWDGNEWG